MEKLGQSLCRIMLTVCTHENVWAIIVRRLLETCGLFSTFVNRIRPKNVLLSRFDMLIQFDAVLCRDSSVGVSAEISIAASLYKIRSVGFILGTGVSDLFNWNVLRIN